MEIVCRLDIEEASAVDITAYAVAGSLVFDVDKNRDMATMLTYRLIDTAFPSATPTGASYPAIHDISPPAISGDIVIWLSL